METRNVQIALDKAREWYSSGNASLKEIALQAFNENELKYNFKDIITFKDACKALGYDGRISCSYSDIVSKAKSIAEISEASAAMFKLNIVRKALNLGYDLSLTKNPENSPIYYPFNPIVVEGSVYFRNIPEAIIGKIKSERVLYNVLNGGADGSGDAGLGSFYSGVCHTSDSSGFLGCASKEIAKHFGKYFGVLITEAKYADMVDFEVIEDKYGNTK